MQASHVLTSSSVGSLPTRMGPAVRAAGAALHSGRCSGAAVRGQRLVSRAGAVDSMFERQDTFADGSGTTCAPILNGCWTLAGGHGRDVYDTIGDTLSAHARAGYTTFDTADIYGPSEQILGEWHRQWVDQGNVPVQLFTKYVPNIFQGVPAAEDVRAAIKRSCAALQVDKLDLVQLHWWDYNIPGMTDVALALTELRSEGVIGSVGVTNLDVAALQTLLDAGVPVASNQVQFSLLDRRPITGGMLDLCEEQGIRVLTYGSLAGGLLSDRYCEEPRKNLFGRPKYSNVDLNTSSLKMYWNIVNKAGGQPLWRALLLTLREVADKHAVSIANVALAWVMAQSPAGLVHPIVGVRSPDHIEDNARVLGVDLDEQDMAKIAAALVDARGPAGDIYSFERAG